MLYEVALKQAAQARPHAQVRKACVPAGSVSAWANRASDVAADALDQLATWLEKKRQIDNRLRHTVERVHAVERVADRLDRRPTPPKGETAAEARKELRLTRSS